ncbi:MAG: Uma2 family endonuclease [Spirosomataceae bacterium]
MAEVMQIPKILIYEEFDGHPVYRKGYKDFLLGLKTVEEIMGTSALQWFITMILTKFLNRNLPDTYYAGSAELGIHISKGNNQSVDIAIYRSGQIKIGLNSINYSQVPPAVVVEVDIKADDSDFFLSESDYFQKKTEKLLQFGVERVIWVTSSTQRVMVADNLEKWVIQTWNQDFEIIDGLSVNLWNLLRENGFEG